MVLQSAAAGALSTLRALDGGTPSGAFVGPARLGQLRGPPELLDVYASAADPATAARLWALTEEALRRRLPVVNAGSTRACPRPAGSRSAQRERELEARLGVLEPLAEEVAELADAVADRLRMHVQRGGDGLHLARPVEPRARASR